MADQKKLLIVDDDKVVHSLIEGALEDDNYQFLNAYDG